MCCFTSQQKCFELNKSRYIFCEGVVRMISPPCDAGDVCLTCETSIHCRYPTHKKKENHHMGTSVWDNGQWASVDIFNHFTFNKTIKRLKMQAITENERNRRDNKINNKMIDKAFFLKIVTDRMTEVDSLSISLLCHITKLMIRILTNKACRRIRSEIGQGH